MTASRKKPARPAKHAAPTPTPPPSPNLETVGDKLKVYSLQNLLHAKRTYKRIEPARLADVLGPWYEKTIARPAEKLGGISELFVAVLPPEVTEKARIAGFSRGILTISVDSAPVRAHLEGLLRGGMLAKLQNLSKGAIFRVKTCVRGTTEDRPLPTTYPHRPAKGIVRL